MLAELYQKHQFTKVSGVGVGGPYSVGGLLRAVVMLLAVLGLDRLVTGIAKVIVTVLVIVTVIVRVTVIVIVIVTVTVIVIVTVTVIVTVIEMRSNSNITV